MAEAFSVIKTFLIAAVIILFLQVRVGGVTLEDRAENFLQKSGIAVYVQSVAAGGVLAVRNLYHGVKSGIVNTVDGYREGSQEQQSKAQR